MEDSEILKITKKVGQIAKREKVYITVQIRYSSGQVQVDVTASDRLTPKGRRLLETVLHINTKPQRESITPQNLLRYGSRTDKTGNKFNLWLFNTATCKIVGTKKEIKDVRKIIEPEIVEYVKEEVDVPIYECPKGTVMKE